MDFSKCLKNINLFLYLGRIRATPQFRSLQESELIVETKKALKHAPEKARHVAAAAAAAAAGKFYFVS
jgi:hypothetical protein